MFLIIEGIHDTGKSTLIDRLCSSKFAFALFKAKRLIPQFEDAKNVQVSDFAFGVNCSVVWFASQLSERHQIVFDRLHLSEYAYGRAIRNTDKFDAIRRFEIIDQTLSTFNVKLVYLECDYEIIQQRQKKKNVVYSKISYEKLTEAFNNALKVTRLPILRLNTGEKNETLIYQEVCRFLEDKCD